MRLDKSKLSDAYKHIKFRARANGSPILICVANDCDAIAANHIFTTLLHADSIQYIMKPVRGYPDVEQALETIDKMTVKCVVLINCGGMEDIFERFKLEEEENSELQVYVIDSHRPFSLENLHVDGVEEDQDIATARVVLIDDGIHEAEVPSILEYALAQEEDEEESDDDEDEDEAEDGEDGAPRERRRLDEEGAAVTSDEAVAERRAAREQRQEQKLAKQAARDKVEHYYNGTKRGMASAILMFTLASNAHKDSNAMLWWAIIGLTEQYVGDEIDRSRYEDEVSAMCEEIMRLNGPTSDQTGAAITFEEDFRFVLMNHWTLSKSMFHSFYVASQLGLWRDRTTSRLHTLLAKMGYPLAEAEQKFVHMRAPLKARLKDSLEEHKSEFGLDDVLFPTFFKERKGREKITAADCLHICSALLSSPPAGGKDWTDAWFEAHDAINYAGAREEEWDVLIRGKSAVQKAIGLQEAVVRKGFELCYEKGRIQNYPKFRVAHFAVDDGTRVLEHPAVLQRLALILMDIDRVNRQGKDPKPIIIGVDNEQEEVCTVAGVVAPSASGFRERNTFGRSFGEAGLQMPGMEVQMQGFDAEVITVRLGAFKDFTHAVVACMVENGGF